MMPVFIQTLVSHHFSFQESFFRRPILVWTCVIQVSKRKRHRSSGPILCKCFQAQPSLLVLLPFEEKLWSMTIHKRPSWKARWVSIPSGSLHKMLTRPFLSLILYMTPTVGLFSGAAVNAAGKQQEPGSSLVPTREWCTELLGDVASCCVPASNPNELMICLPIGLSVPYLYLMWINVSLPLTKTNHITKPISSRST